MKTILVDFDGVLHSYVSGWKGATEIPDPPVPGAIKWLERLIEDGRFNVCIYSSRSKETEKWLVYSGIGSDSDFVEIDARVGIEAMQGWLVAHGLLEDLVERIGFPTEKPAAFLTIDDRAICFTGTFPPLDEINNFKPWNKK